MMMADAKEQLANALGATPAARLAASALIEADAIGLPRFGITMLDEWQPDAVPLPSLPMGQAVTWLDCSSCFAPLAVANATLEIAGAARSNGMAAVFMRGVMGFGRLAPFVRHLADAGLVGMAGAEGPPFVAPVGGSRPVIGTNPFAFAMGKGSAQTVIDAASSSATMADIRNARTAATPLADNIAFDREGQPTNIAAEVAAVLPRGGKLGSLLGLTVELLAGVAGGGRGDPRGRGVFILAFEPDRADGANAWEARLAALRDDWTGAGGHWPRGKGVADDTVLDDAFERRLQAHLARLAETVPTPGRES